MHPKKGFPFQSCPTLVKLPFVSRPWFISRSLSRLVIPGNPIVLPIGAMWLCVSTSRYSGWYLADWWDIWPVVVQLIKFHCYVSHKWFTTACIINILNHDMMWSGESSLQYEMQGLQWKGYNRHWICENRSMCPNKVYAFFWNIKVCGIYSLLKMPH